MSPARRHKRTDQLWNLLTILALAAALIIAAAVVIIYLNPHNVLNPFPPLALPAEIFYPKSTGQPTQQPTIQTMPTVTDAAVTIATVTPQIQPTLTPAWQTTPTQPAGTLVNILYDFELLSSPEGMPASLYDPNRGCDWMGIAGEVMDIQGSPVRGIRVSLQGNLEGREIDLISMSGTALTYGSAGFEFFLGDRLIASTGQMTVQLIDQAGLPLSEKIPLDTYSDCEKNLIWLDFIEVR